MTLHRLYLGAFVIFASLILAGLFGGPVFAFSEKKDPAAINGPIRLNMANDARQTYNVYDPRDLDFYLGANSRNGKKFRPENLYSSNLNKEANPVEIGGFRLRF